MTEQEEHSGKDANRKEELRSHEADLLAKDKVRKKTYSDREQAIEKAGKVKETERVEKLATDEIKELAKEKARKEAYVAREKAIAEAQEARKLKDKNQPHE